MRRSLTRSVFGFVLAAAFVVARAEEATGALHCPHHDAVPGGAVAAADGSADPGTPPHGRHDAGTGVGDAQPGHGEDAGHGVCTCMGACQSATAFSLPTPSIAVVLLRLPQAPERPAPDAPLPARVAQPHTIPYANAPPPLR